MHCTGIKFKSYLFITLSKSTETDRERDLPSIGSFPKCNSEDWARMKPRAPAGAPLWVTESQDLGPALAASRDGHYQGAGQVEK